MAKTNNVIYQDSDLLIVDKAAGWVTTKENSKSQIPNLNTKSPPTPSLKKRGNINNVNKGNIYLEDWIGENFPNDLPRKGIVHRLDKGTSGLVAAARNEAALKNLKEQFKKRTVKKIYLALAGGDLPREGEINMPIGRVQYDISKFKVGVEGKAARTVFRVVKKIKIDGRIYSLVEVDLKTGRTHQIRVHFSYLKWPLLGDRLYGGLTGILERPFLHAWRLELDHPESGQKMKFEAPVPTDLKDILEEYV